MARQFKVTQRQIEAYRLVMMADFSQDEAAEIMGISQQRVSKLLRRLTQHYPHLFGDEQKGRAKIVSYHSSMDSKIVRKF